MQLLEYFMWKDQECKGLNQKTTKIGNIFFILNLIIWLLSGIIGSYRCQGVVDIPSGSLWCMMAFLGPLFGIYINK